MGFIIVDAMHALPSVLLPNGAQGICGAPTACFFRKQHGAVRSVHAPIVRGVEGVKTNPSHPAVAQQATSQSLTARTACPLGSFWTQPASWPGISWASVVDRTLQEAGGGGAGGGPAGRRNL